MKKPNKDEKKSESTQRCVLELVELVAAVLQRNAGRTAARERPDLRNKNDSFPVTSEKLSRKITR